MQQLIKVEYDIENQYGDRKTMTQDFYMDASWADEYFLWQAKMTLLNRTRCENIRLIGDPRFFSLKRMNGRLEM